MGRALTSYIQTPSPYQYWSHFHPYEEGRPDLEKGEWVVYGHTVISNEDGPRVSFPDSSSITPHFLPQSWIFVAYFINYMDKIAYIVALALSVLK